MNERGHIPYSSSKPLPESCYDEVRVAADILVGIIGGRYGSDSGNDAYSISMQEIKTAIQYHKQVFIFVDKSVLTENEFYLRNKDVAGVTFPRVDDVKIHKFIEEIRSLPINNALTGFESAADITAFLREQFAGLFQRLLQEKATLTEQTTLYDLKEAIQDLKTTSDDIKHDYEVFTSKFRGSIFAVNSVVNKISKYVGIDKWVAIANDKESLLELLHCIGFSAVEDDDEDYDVFGADVFKRHSTKTIEVLSIEKDIFDSDNRIKDIRKPDFIDKYIRYEKRTVQESYNFAELDMDDGELPF